MKYIIHPLVGLIFYLLIILIYIAWQCIHLIWHLKPNKFIMARLFEGCYYHLSRRYSANSNWFDHKKYIDYMLYQHHYLNGQNG